MAQIKITANEHRKTTINNILAYVKSDLGINLKDFHIWRIAFILSLKKYSSNIDLNQYKNENNLTVSQGYETLVDNETKYIFLNLLSIVHNKKIDIKEEFPELLKLHCRHGFDILESHIEDIGVNDNIIDFFLNQLEIPQKTTKNINFNNIDNNFISKLKKVLSEIKAPLKFIEKKSFDRVTKLYFDVQDLKYATNTKLYSSNLIRQLETATALRDKIYIQQTKIERTITINIKKDNQPIYIADYIYNVNKNDLSVVVGMDDEDNLEIANLKELVHLLVAGTTGSGKTIFLHSLIYQLIQKNIELYLIDGKNGHEFGKYQNRANVVIESDEIIGVINNIIQNMEYRYTDDYLSDSKPIIVIVDEFVDLIMQKNIIEDLFVRLAQKGRGAKIHLILATQRPDSSILKGILRANFTSRVAFKVQKSTESKIILDEIGAENLFGKGDMLFSDGKEIKRLQGFLVE
ncbi:MAG TPA: DNA translocase FtsK [Flavobacteriia bacterium]|nr:DNA translocase FtsK [Flavobacteriia bacterium]